MCALPSCCRPVGPSSGWAPFLIKRYYLRFPTNHSSPSLFIFNSNRRITRLDEFFEALRLQQVKVKLLHIESRTKGECVREITWNSLRKSLGKRRREKNLSMSIGSSDTMETALVASCLQEVWLQNETHTHIQRHTTIPNSHSSNSLSHVPVGIQQ